jgi:oxygen-independent coproporphyrinogen-3 oxidase
MNEAAEASLYIHVPFCAAVCDYCDFYSIPVGPNDKRMDRFVDLVLGDVRDALQKWKPLRVPTVYVGGGTPSVLGTGRLDRLLGGLGALLPGPAEEFTLEVNPESSSPALLRICGDRGVTRLSVGVQSFHEASRAAVHRTGEGKLLPERLQEIAAVFPGAFSVDLISGLPFQDEYIVLKDIEKILSYEPGHVSLYDLTLEEGTPLAERVGRGDCLLPHPDSAAELWLAGAGALEAAGYTHYEVSNFAIPGKESRHNLRYWRMLNWLGLGPAASGTLIDDSAGTGLRIDVTPDVTAYIERKRRGPPCAEEKLDSSVLIRESLLMGFRCLEGPDAALFRKRFRRDIGDLIPQTLAAWASRAGLGQDLLQKDRPALTGKGLCFLNSFLLDAFRELD